MLTAVSTIIRKNSSMLCIFRIANRLEMEKLTDEYSWLIGRDEFIEMYNLAAGKLSPPYSYFTIMCLESDPKKMFYARFDQRLFVEDSEGEVEEEQIAPRPTPQPKPQPKPPPTPQPTLRR